MEAKLTWVRLNAELKNWRNVGRESLAFLVERRKERERKQPVSIRMGPMETGEGDKRWRGESEHRVKQTETPFDHQML